MSGRDDVEVEWSDSAAEETTEKQKAILETAVLNPEMSHAEVAAETDSSTSYVRQIRKEYEDNIEVDEQSESAGLGPVIGLVILLVLAYVGYQMFVATP